MFISTEPWTYARLKSNIESGLLKIPQFQRDFVWSKEQSAKLIDSILKIIQLTLLLFGKQKKILDILET